MVARIGYDLFSEVRTLLTSGQPVANASLPVLDLHIAFLRDLITSCGIPLVEIPPVPDGYQFAACLTHDVDHPSIRHHKWDHTMFGFLYRAIFDSLRKTLSGQMSVRNLFRNWAAALKLPFVHLGLAKDFWREFDDRYLELEKGLRSTFFVIPFSNRPGNKSSGPAPSIRAARYGAQDIADAIHKLTAAGCEVGLHGIDAWLDSSKGRQELDEIRRVTGTSEVGVRMHWLYYDQQSPVVLEQAGAIYDSTIGYNETVGYRAGTTQAYKPLNTNQLLELPLHIMDTALFYPSHLGLSRQQAESLVRPMLDNAVHLGGALTINWHDRSLAPERLWGEFYSDLIQDLKSRGAWFSTASQAIAWFRKRRSAEFETDGSAPGGVRAHVAVDQRDNLPALRLRIHAPRKLGSITTHGSESYVDTVVGESYGSRSSLRGREMSNPTTNIASQENGLLQRDRFIVGPDDRILVTGAAGFIGSRVFRICWIEVCVTSSALSGHRANCPRSKQSSSTARPMLESKCAKAIFFLEKTAKQRPRMFRSSFTSQPELGRSLFPMHF